MRLFLLSVVLLLSSTLTAQQVEFEKSKHDFGTIAEADGLAYVGFRYKNVSDKPFVINNVVTSCGCTTPEYRKAPLMPGEESVIKVAFNPQGRPGYFSKDIVIYSDNRRHEDRLIISGSVTPRPLTTEEQFPVDGGGSIRYSTSLISLPAIDRGNNYTQVIDIYNSSKESIELKARTLHKGTEVKFVEPTLKSEGATQMSYTLNLDDSAELGHFSDSIFVSYNGIESRVPIKVEATVVPNFSTLTQAEMASSPQIFLSSQFYHFSSVDQNKRLEHIITIDNRGNRPLILEKIYSSSPLLTYIVGGRVIAPGASVRMTLMLNSATEVGRLSEKLTIICNDPSMPAKEIRLAASVRAK